MKIIKGIKDVTEQRIYSDDIDDVHATIPDNVSNLKRCCLKNKNFILKNIPIPKCNNYGHIVKASAEEPIRFALLIGLPITMLDPENIVYNISKITKNMIGHGKGLRKELLKLALEIK